MSVATFEEAAVEKIRPATQKKARRKKRKAFPRWVQEVGGWGVAAAVKSWMGTLDMQAVFADIRVNPLAADFQGPAIFVVWHEYFLFPLYVRGPKEVAVLASRHRDAEWVSRAAERLGFKAVRGSGRRGGLAALLGLLRCGSRLSLAITCDGPRGPRRQMAPGAIYLASRLQVPLVGLGIGYDSPWRVNSWDRFAIPRPWSRARVVVTSPYHVAADADRETLEAARIDFQSMLAGATQEAESWAESGERRDDQVKVLRRGGPRCE